MNVPTVNRWLRVYDQSLALDSQKLCYLSYDSRRTLMLSLAPEGDRLMFYTPLMPIGDDSQLLKVALACNLYQDKNNVGSVGFDELTSHLVYSYCLNLNDVGEAQFHETIDGVTRNAKMLIQKLEKFNQHTIQTDGKENPKSTRDLQADNPLNKITNNFIRHHLESASG